MSTNFKQFTAPIAVLFHRLERDIADGRPLAANAETKDLALKVRQQVKWEVSGRDDLPMICPIDLSGIDEIFAGANAKPGDTYSNNLATACEFVFLLSAHRDFGICKFSEDDPNGMMDLLSLIFDSLARNDAGEVDALLDKTCKQPFMLRYDNGTPTDLAFAISITVTYYPLAFERGTRSDDRAVPWE